MKIDARMIELKWHSILSMLRLLYSDIFPSSCPEMALIDDMIDVIEARRYTVAVMGAFNRGKSSLINAMLGANVLPADVTPTTATVSRIQYGDVPSLCLSLRNGSEECIDIALGTDISEVLKARVTKLTEEYERASGIVHEAIIKFPTPLCQNNASYIDTPGFEDAAKMDAISKEALLHSDAVVVVISAQIPYSMTEAECIADLLSMGKIRNIHFVCTHMDLIPEKDRERVLAHIKKRIQEVTLKKLLKRRNLTPEALKLAEALLKDPLILGVSSLLALNAITSDDHSAFLLSGIPCFQHSLVESVSEQQRAYIVDHVGGYICQQTARFERQANLYKNALLTMLQERQNAKEKIEKYLKTVAPGLQSRIEQCDMDIKLVVPSFEKLEGEARVHCIGALGALRDDTLMALTMLIYEQIKNYQQRLASESVEMCNRANQSFCKLLSALTQENASLVKLCHSAASNAEVSPFDYITLLPKELFEPPKQASITESEIVSRLNEDPSYRLDPVSFLASYIKAAFSTFMFQWEHVLASLRKAIIITNQTQNAIVLDAISAEPPEEKQLLSLSDAREKWEPLIRTWQDECIACQHAYWQNEQCLQKEKGANDMTNG